MIVYVISGGAELHMWWETGTTGHNESLPLPNMLVDVTSGGINTMECFILNDATFLYYVAFNIQVTPLSTFFIKFWKISNWTRNVIEHKKAST